MKRFHVISVIIISTLCVALLLLFAQAYSAESFINWTIGSDWYCFGLTSQVHVLSLWLPVAYHTDILLGPLSIGFECRPAFVPLWIVGIVAFVVGARRLYRTYVRPRLTTRSSEQAGR